MNEETIQKVVLWSPLVASMVGGVFISLIVDYVTPGRKGKLRTERDHFFEGRTVGEIRKEMERRLVEENFTMVDSGVANKIVGTRKGSKRPKDSAMKDYAFEKLKLEAEVVFEERADGALARMAVSTPETITRDTGEGEYFEVMLDYLMMSRSLRPMSPVPNIQASMALYESIVLLFLPVMFFVAKMPEAIARQFFLGLLTATFAVMVIAVLGIIKIALKKGVYSGYKHAIIGIALSLLGAGAAFGIVYVKYIA